MLIATCECGHVVRSRVAPEDRLGDIDQQLDLHVCPARSLVCPPGWDPLEWAKHRFPSCAWGEAELLAAMTPTMVEDMAHKLELWNDKQQRPRESVYVSRRDNTVVRLDPRPESKPRSRSRVYKVG